MRQSDRLTFKNKSIASKGEVGQGGQQQGSAGLEGVAGSKREERRKQSKEGKSCGESEGSRWMGSGKDITTRSEA